MSTRRRIASVLLSLALVGLAGCGDDEPDDGDLAAEDTTSTSESTSTTGPATTTSAPEPSTTMAAGNEFKGTTSPTSTPAPPDLTVALLTAVEVGAGDGVDRVSFTFEGGIPGYDVSYIDPPVRQDGSGDEVEVDGTAFLSIRFAPASGFDAFETFEPTYTGPSEVRGDTEVVTEAVRVGDFEANLTWVVGVDEKVPYRIDTDPATGTVTVELSAG
ncbi:MAG TPA: hypothetical protein VGR26_06285 [Acidimicrobiales bacterium]|nr:hypothetical protein [Acidimicrobiales bacterium]